MSPFRCLFRSSVATIVAIGLAAGCVGGPQRGTPLYGAGAGPRPLTDVAQLYGEIATVDGRDVSGSGQSFELLPGCHVVTTRTSWGKRENSGSMSGNLPKYAFAIHAQANHSYVIDFELAARTGNGGTLELRALEKDASGRVTAELVPAADPAELERCSAPVGAPNRG